MAKGQVPLSCITFALALEELIAGPSTAHSIAEHSGMNYRTACRLLRALHGKKLVHISDWDKDSLGRMGMRAVFSLGHGRDAKRAAKPREQVNRDYRNKVARAALAGTPFMGLGA